MAVSTVRSEMNRNAQLTSYLSVSPGMKLTEFRAALSDAIKLIKVTPHGHAQSLVF